MSCPLSSLAQGCQRRGLGETLKRRRRSIPALLKPGWADRQVVEQTLTLQLPAGLPAGEYRVEMAPQATSSLDSRVGGNAAAEPDKPNDNDRRAGAAESTVVFGEFGTARGLGFGRPRRYLAVGLTVGCAGISTVQGQVFRAWDRLGRGDCGAGGSVSWRRCPARRPQTGSRANWCDSVSESSGRKTRGTYRSLYLGIYDPDTGQRLPVTAGGQILSDGRYPLGQVTATRWTFRRKVQSFPSYAIGPFFGERSNLFPSLRRLDLSRKKGPIGST